MVIVLLIAGMFALPVMFAGGLFVVAHWGPFFGIELGVGQSEHIPAADAAAQALPQEPSRPVRRAA